MRRFLKRFVIAAAVLAVIVGLVWLVWQAGSRPRFSVGPALPPGKVSPQIVSGSFGVALLAPDGSLWFLGRNPPASAIAVATSTATNPPVNPSTNFPPPPPVRLGTDSDWARVACSSSFLIALKTDGTLWDWPPAIKPRTTDQVPVSAMSPTRIGTDNDWADISGGLSHYLALKRDGSLWARGQNVYGQLGDRTRSSRRDLVQIGPDHDWKAISAGMANSYALKSNGTLWGWGMDPVGSSSARTNDLAPRQFDSGTNWSAISAGDFYLLALKSDGTLWLLGQKPPFSGRGPVPNATAVPEQIGTDHDWTGICSGFKCFFARKRGGSWWGCGLNTDTQLGVGTAPSLNDPWGAVPLVASPTRLPFEFDPWAFAPDGQYLHTTTMLARDGTVWTWGSRIGNNERGPISFLKFKLAMNNFFKKLPGHKQPFNTSVKLSSPVPYRYWELPPEIRQSLGKPAPPVSLH